jgi:hypothetical protein
MLGRILKPPFPGDPFAAWLHGIRFQFVDRPLVRGIERANGIDLVVEPLDAISARGCKREEIHDSPADAKMPLLLDSVYPLVAQFDHSAEELIHRQRVADLKIDMRFRHRLQIRLKSPNPRERHDNNAAEAFRKLENNL